MPDMESARMFPTADKDGKVDKKAVPRYEHLPTLQELNKEANKHFEQRDAKAHIPEIKYEQKPYGIDFVAANPDEAKQIKNWADSENKSREKVLIETILEQREKRYGSFEGHSRITQSLKECMREESNWNKLSDSMKESLEMIAHKIGRILNGDPNYKDSWTDIIGYAKLVEQELKD